MKKKTTQGTQGTIASDWPPLKVWHFGYRGADPQQTADRIASLGAALVDVRYSAGRPQSPWSPHNLRRLMSDRFRRVQALGNVNYKNGGPILLASPDEGFALLREIAGEFNGRVVLMCACENYDECHRKVVIDALRIKAPIESLEPLFAPAALPAEAPALFPCS